MQPPDRLDLVLQGGKIVDGAGNPWYYGDVGIRDGRIEAIGRLDAVESVARIDVAGLVVSPGFIDPHTHADRDLRQLPHCQNYLHQGVTTVVGGNCGDSLYPIGETLDSLRALPLGINFAQLLGHGTVRQQVMGMADRPATGQELSAMADLVAQGMAQGALGMSTGLRYAPGCYAQLEEVVELSRVVARFGGVYTTHVRDDSGDSVGLVPATEEAIAVARRSRVPVQISHLKATGRDEWGKAPLLVGMIEDARREGLDVTFDQYPYAATGGRLSGTLPPRWALEGGHEKFKERFRDPAIQQRIREGTMANVDRRGGPDAIFVARFAPDPGLEGKSLALIGEGMGLDAVDAGLEMLSVSDGYIVVFSLKDGDVDHIAGSPLGMVGSDGNLADFGVGTPHPRCYGTFPRFLARFVREKRLLTLEEAVRRMTSAPANRMRLGPRGLLKEGMIADITVFDPEAIADRATFDEPHQHPVGVEYVIVNGQVALENGKSRGVSPGHVIRRAGSA